MEAASLPQPESPHPESLIPEPFGELYEDAVQISNLSTLKDDAKAHADRKIHEAQSISFTYKGVEYDSAESYFKGPNAARHSHTYRPLGYLHFKNGTKQIRLEFEEGRPPLMRVMLENGRWPEHEHEITLEQAAELGPALAELKSGLVKRKTGYIALAPQIN